MVTSFSQCHYYHRVFTLLGHSSYSAITITVPLLSYHCFHKHHDTLTGLINFRINP